MRAFAMFDEPHAWLVRGLVEYGWRDASRTHVGDGCFDLSKLAESQGRSGVVLQVQGNPQLGEELYRFEVKLSRNDSGPVFVVRSPECNFFQEYPHDPDNGLYAAGYIHQALGPYVQQFVAWRRAGGELTWAQRKGLPEVQGEPCSAALAAFVANRIRNADMPFERGAAEGWWLEGAMPPTATWSEPRGTSGGPVPSAPVAWVGQVRPSVTADLDVIRARVKRAGMSLMALAGLGALQALLWLINAIVTVALYGTEELHAIVASVVLFVGLLIGAAIAAVGSRSYLTLQSSVLVYASALYAALLPGCCWMGLPVGVWAMVEWHRPDVREARRALATR